MAMEAKIMAVLPFKTGIGIPAPVFPPSISFMSIPYVTPSHAASPATTPSPNPAFGFVGE